MTIAPKSTIKTYFETNDRPTQSNFTDLIDSFLGLGETTAQTVSALVNFPHGITVSGNTIGTAAYLNTGVSANNIPVLDSSNRLPAVNGSLLTGINGKVVPHQVTDSTDVALTQFTTQSNIGSSFSAVIPTNGVILLLFTGNINYATSTNDGFYLGLRIASTNFWPKWTSNSANMLTQVPSTTGGETMFTTGDRIDGGTGGLFPVFLPIEALGIPTGTQTIQIIGSKASSNTVTLKGTIVTTRVNFIAIDCT